MAAPETPNALGTCPTDEDLAAFLDDMLPNQERARITSHLAVCESCYEIFAGALHFQQDKITVEPTGRVVPFPSGNHRGGGVRKSWWIPAAAAAVLAIGFGWVGYRSYGPKITVATLTEDLVDQPDVEKHLFEVTYRGGEDEEGDILSQAPAFMTGVYLVDLHLAEKNADVSADILRRIYARIRKIPFMGTDADEFLRDANQLEKSPSPAVLRQIAAGSPTREAKLDELLPFAFAFGKWTEAGRLAAEIRSPEFFKSWTNRRFLNSLLKNPRQLEEGAAEPVKAIQKLWGRGDLQAADYDMLAEHFRTIIQRYDT
jgi:hypothetical protein